MNKIWIVLKTEFINTVTRRSFLITLILVPLLPALILGGINLFRGDESGEEDIGSIFQPSDPTTMTEGYLDRANIIKSIPEWIPEGHLVRYESEDQAQKDAIAGKITGYYVIEASYLEDGAIRYIRNEFNPLSAMETTSMINNVLEYNLLGADPQKFKTFQNPVQIERIDLSPDETDRDTSSPLAFYIPYGVTMLFYILILTSASLMLNSIAKEKENRIMEVLMSSLKPKELLTGKILGLGFVGLLQMLIWLGSALLLLRLGGTTLNIPPDLQLSPDILLWGALFFILGYLIYATIMAGVGALVPNLKEATQATFIIILPILIPLVLVGVIINQPNTTLPVILSLIPLTAPNTIMTRLAVGPVPLWQLLLAVGLMVLTIILLLRAVAGMFRAQLLLTGKKFSLGLFLKTLFSKTNETGEKAN